MYKLGDILKSKTGTITNQTFIILTNVSSDEETACVILFDNLSNNVAGDSTRGFNMNDYELTTLKEFSDFIFYNNL